MFSFFKRSEQDPLGKIEQVPGGVGLFAPSGELVQTYTRKRDAVRGATRRGIKLG